MRKGGGGGGRGGEGAVRFRIPAASFSGRSHPEDARPCPRKMDTNPGNSDPTRKADHDPFGEKEEGGGGGGGSNVGVQSDLDAC